MSRTLRRYLAWDLIKATLLTTVVFTVVMTVFVIIEPLRNWGLSGEQALMLFGYSMPVMVSLTLPIAAMFASTIVYGRFSQDNELMACRASGISTLSLLTPVIWLGGVVSIVTLVLGLYVAPWLLWNSTARLRSNLEHFAYHRLSSQHFIRLEQSIVHVEQVDPDSGTLVGVVGVNFQNPTDYGCVVASSAKLEFINGENGLIAQFDPYQPAAFRQSGLGELGLAEEQRIQRGALPSLFEEQPKLYTWSQLWKVWSQPMEAGPVKSRVRDIKRQITVHRFYDDLVRPFSVRGPELARYDKLREPPDTVHAIPEGVAIEAREARLSDNGEEVVFGAPKPSGSAAATAPVERNVHVYHYQYPPGQPPRLLQMLKARTMHVKGVWDASRNMAVVGITLDDVDIQDVNLPPEKALHMDAYHLGDFAVPAEIAQACESIQLDDLYARPDQYRFSKVLSGMIDRLQKGTVKSLLAKVSAEIHQRLAYGIDCMLLVMLGAALGLVFRGGQILSAVAVSAVPGVIVVLLLVMGRHMLSNTGVSPIYGILAIWGGTAALAGAVLYVYAGPMRR